jgi:hypothetical protein
VYLLAPCPQTPSVYISPSIQQTKFKPINTPGKIVVQDPVHFNEKVFVYTRLREKQIFYTKQNYVTYSAQTINGI